MQQLEFWAVIPFILMLLSIAVIPLFAEHWWEKNSNKLLLALLLSIPIVIYLSHIGLSEKVIHSITTDYIPFIILLGTLFTVSGGIHITGHIQARPRNNTLLLIAGIALASIIGTTGASMLLIQLILQVNRHRQYRAHTILFFIALVANCGGILTPLGDPPLFLLYLRGVEFAWFLKLAPQWAFVCGMLLIIYFALDNYLFYYKESTQNIMGDFHAKSHPSVKGKRNIIYLLMVILIVCFINPSFIPAMEHTAAPLYLKYLREITLLGIALLSLLTTNKNIRQSNNFSWHPIIEVAFLFIGIFITMTPALLLLDAHAAALGITQPHQYYYAAGALSAFLDNSPTTVAFYTLAQALPEQNPIIAGINQNILEAIAMGAVFFGAMTYIGNGPNFMIKAIAEKEGVKMPSFFGYMLKFSLIVLLPIYILTQLLFIH